MLLRTLWSHLRGYVIIRAKGSRLEAFINEAVAAGVHLWLLERATPRLLVARMEAAEFARLARMGRRLGVRVTVLHKGGAPFVLVRARQRRTFIAGGVLFALLLYGLAQYVWFVDVQGTEDVEAEAVLAAAARGGLHPGALRAEVERDAVVYGLHRDLPRVAWAGIELRGALATVRIVERTEADPSVYVPGHIVAAQDGIVERLVVTQGHALVSIGDTVEEGQLLISGMLTPGSAPYVERLQAGTLPVVRAEGSVWGRVWYQGYAEVILSQDEGVALTPETIQAAKDQAVASANAAVDRHLPPGAELRERDVSISEGLDRLPAIIRATATVSVYQNLGRFSPVVNSPEVDSNGPKDESDGPEDGQFDRTRQ